MTLLANQVDIDLRAPMSRLNRLLDRDTLVPVHGDTDAAVRVATGHAGGVPVVAYCTDARRGGGSLGAAEAERVIQAVDLAIARRCPVIGLWHSGGAKLADGVESMDGVGRMFAAMTAASGTIPQLSVVLGPAAGAAAYGPALNDLVVMATSGRLFINGPDVVRSVTGEQIDMEGLGGAQTHGCRSGVVHVTVDTEDEAYASARGLANLFAAPGVFDLTTLPDDPDLGNHLPASPHEAYDVRPLVRAITDDASFVELQPRWAENMVVGLGRLAGRTIGLLANNPLRTGGWLDSLSAEKASRFVRMCDAFGIPLLVVVDAPGYLPGVAQEWDGVVRRSAKLLHAFAASVVPRVTLITRRSHGGAYIAMNSRSLGATAVFAWPGSEVAIMGAEAAVGVLHRKKLAATPPEDRERLRADLIAEQHRLAGGVDRALRIGVIDEVIAPHETRRRLAVALAAAPACRGTHTNIPL